MDKEFMQDMQDLFMDDDKKQNNNNNAVNSITKKFKVPPMEPIKMPK